MMNNQRLLELLARDGQLDLICERSQIDPVDLVRDLVEQRSEDTIDIIKFMMALRSYSLLMQVDTALAIQLDDMSPSELARFRRDLAGSISGMLGPDSDDSATDDNIEDDPKLKLISKFDELAERRALGTGTNGHVE